MHYVVNINRFDFLIFLYNTLPILGHDMYTFKNTVFIKNDVECRILIPIDMQYDFFYKNIIIYDTDMLPKP